MSLAIGKEGQNARLAYKLTGWRIDIKGPESLLEAGGEFFRSARDSASEMMPDFNMQGRQPRPVQADGMVSLSGRSYGPLSEDLFRRQVDVEARDGVVEIYYDRELRARYDQSTGALLPLDGTEPVDGAQLETTTVGDTDGS